MSNLTNIFKPFKHRLHTVALLFFLSFVVFVFVCTVLLIKLCRASKSEGADSCFCKDFLADGQKTSYIIDGVNLDDVTYFKGIEGLIAAYEDIWTDNHRIHLAVIANGAEDFERKKTAFNILLPTMRKTQSQALRLAFFE